MTGWKVRRVTSLGRYDPDPASEAFEGHIVLGEGLTLARAQAGAGESLRPLALPVPRTYRRLHLGRIRAGSAIVGLALAEARLRTRGLLSNTASDR